MRIAIPMKTYDATWGGPGTYTIELVNRLVGKNPQHEYVLVYPRDVVPRSEATGCGSEPNVHEVRSNVKRGLFWDQHILPSVAMRERADVLFSPFMTIPVRGRFRKVFTVLGAERYVVPDMLPADQHAKWVLMERFFIPRADRIIALSHTMAEDFCRATQCPAGKVRSVYLGVDADFAPVRDEARLAEVRRKYGLPPRFLLFVGRIFPNKNFGNLLRGFAASTTRATHELLAVGGVRWKFEGDQALISSLGLSDRVRMLDFLPREDVIAIYSMAECLLYPSWYESFGLAQLEAMACGCPVVAANTGALPEVAGDAVVYCDPHDPSTIGAAIDRIVGEAGLRDKLVCAGLRRAKEFTWERCATETLEVLEAA